VVRVGCASPGKKACLGLVQGKVEVLMFKSTKTRLKEVNSPKSKRGRKKHPTRLFAQRKKDDATDLNDGDETNNSSTALGETGRRKRSSNEKTSKMTDGGEQVMIIEEAGKMFRGRTVEVDCDPEERAKKEARCNPC